MRHVIAEPRDAESRGRSAYRFGAFVLDPEAHLLLRDGEPVPLPPKAFDTLVILVRRTGSLVAKEDLLRELWPDSYVEENNLNQYISTLRKALGENGNGSKYIDTVPRRGYRFIAEVREEGTELGKVVSHRATWRTKFAVALVALAALLLLLLAAYRFWSSRRVPVVSASPRTLAVLPLRNLKPDPETDFLSLALADAIANRLGYASELTVAPFSSSSIAKYRSADVDPRQVAHELNVQNVLAGSYVKEGDELRVTMELINVGKDANAWRDNIELRYDKLLTVQDHVAVSVIHSMGLELQPQEAELLKKDVPTNPAAYEYYLRGLDQGFKSNFERGMHLLEKSASLDPDNAMVWAELGDARMAYARIQGGAPVYVEKGWDAFHRAVTLNGTNRFIVDTMAFQLIENNKAEEAIPLLRESLRHNANDSFAHWYLSEAYRYGGALQQSIAEGELALKLNPNVAQNMLFNTYLYVGDYKKFLASVPQDESNARTDFYRGLAYYSLGDTGKAVNEFDRAYALNPSLMHAQIGRALTFAVAKRQHDGIELMGRIERSESEDGEMVYKMAEASAQLGDRNSSLRLLERSIELNFHPYSYFLHDPLLNSIRTEPQYANVMKLAEERQAAFLRRFF